MHHLLIELEYSISNILNSAHIAGREKYATCTMHAKMSENLLHRRTAFFFKKKEISNVSCIQNVRKPTPWKN